METLLILGLVTAQRLGELALSNRNTARLLARGAREAAPGHYRYMVMLHALWLAGLWWLAPGRPVNPWLLAVYVLLQGLRVWVLAALGGRWTTRIIVLPRAPLVRRGPYRFLTHPNYVVVAGEIAVLPLMFGLDGYAVAFSLLNALVLYIRIRAENAALGIGAHRVPG
ncbi:isoprenylcysteine carboxyl methyltransferase family protein [Ancylobacter sp.]|uniref:isoprenylcysteine carboxyl methyltransferase family protein n=1 Tax=Ancylobacter sp. TaxID=1872567 RepID=UPI003D10B68F